MDSATAALLELLLVFGVVIGWGLWEIRSTDRSLRRDRDAAARESEPPESG